MDFASIPLFNELTDEQKVRLSKISQQENIAGGSVLMYEGEPSDALYYVISGRFVVTIESQPTWHSELRAGQSIGEIGFLSGEPRTATVTAIRDAIVLKLSRDRFEELCKDFPEILNDLCASLARKLAATTQSSGVAPQELPRTIAICPAGISDIHNFDIQLQQTLSKLGKTRILKQAEIEQQFPGKDIGSGQIIEWLYQLEQENDFLLYVVDGGASDWSAISLRQADLVVLVGQTDNPNSEQNTALNESEKLVYNLHKPQAVHLALVRREQQQILPSSTWLANRPLNLHHHVQHNSVSDLDRLGRFITGQARGFIASGGGAYTAAHVGVIRAMQEEGIDFDFVGGASGGAAMSAALAMKDISMDELSNQIQKIFVDSGVMRKFTLPVFSILDHTAFDKSLRAAYGDRNIEDLPIPFFAQSTSLTTGEPVVHRSGSLWKAIRASSSIPGLLPPVTLDDGEILVDGGILDNIPVETMKTIKSGPNLVVCFEPKHETRVVDSYESLPDRKKLILNLITLNRKKLPNLPKIGSVLTQSMLLNNNSLDKVEDDDVILQLTLPKNIRLNDWQHHKMITEQGYKLTKEWLRQTENVRILKNFKHQ